WSAAPRRPGEFAPERGKFLPQPALLERYLQGAGDDAQVSLRNGPQENKKRLNLHGEIAH
ncbi:hypothetical protein HispidOSU_009638, partial [Sigmodon hispidus]